MLPILRSELGNLLCLYDSEEQFYISHWKGTPKEETYQFKFDSSIGKTPIVVANLGDFSLFPTDKDFQIRAETGLFAKLVLYRPY